MRFLRRLLVVVAALALLFAAFVLRRVGPGNVLAMIRYDQSREGRLKPGDAAPDAALVSLDGKTPVRVSEKVGGKPLILIFGSYT